jgi:hypothetical protein
MEHKEKFYRIISLCEIIWNFAEDNKICLGRLAPYIFNGMLGCKKMKNQTKEQSHE